MTDPKSIKRLSPKSWLVSSRPLPKFTSRRKELAYRVWSIREVRCSVFDYLPRKDLLRYMTLDRATFRDAAGPLMRRFYWPYYKTIISSGVALVGFHLEKDSPDLPLRTVSTCT